MKVVSAGARVSACSHSQMHIYHLGNLPLFVALTRDDITIPHVCSTHLLATSFDAFLTDERVPRRQRSPPPPKKLAAIAKQYA